MSKFKLVSFSKELDKKFKWINWIILLPILLWPLVFFGSIFIFDNPKVVWKAFGLFFLVNSYPLFLFILFEVNARFYTRFRLVGYIIPISILSVLSYGIMKEVISTKQFAEERKAEKQKRKELGYIGSCDTYKIKANIVYYKDSIMKADPETFEYLSCHYGKDINVAFSGKDPIEGSHPETFEIIDWQWQRDKYLYYNKGVPMVNIDYESFEILIANYSKDKFHVYFYDKIIENADPSTFQVNEMTHIARDKNNEYKFGKIIANR